MKKIYYLLIGMCCCLNLMVADAAELLPDVAIAERGQHVVINIPQARLFLFEDGKLLNIFPTGAGKPKTQTPLGEYTITEKRNKPTWYIPASIQKERAAKGDPDVKFIRYGEPGHPLGPVFVRFGEPKLGLGIHGTSAPSSVPGWPSHGCVRLRNENALKFAKTVEIDTPVSVIHQRYALNQDDDGQLWLAVYPNKYSVKNDLKEELLIALEQWSTQNDAQIDQDRLKKILGKQVRSLCLTCTDKKPKVSGELHPIAWTDGLAQIRLPVDMSKMQLEDDVPHTIQDGEEKIDYSSHEGWITPGDGQELLPSNVTQDNLEGLF
ncbi:MAG: L,D-transpeptidase [Neisseriaceae bacterium]|nr:L,D-transpeptidase [Neisseriaceae bacterium]